MADKKENLIEEEVKETKKAFPLGLRAFKSINLHDYELFHSFYSLVWRYWCK